MGLKIEKINLSDIEIHKDLRFDKKYFAYKELINNKNSNLELITLKEVLSGYFKGFAFKSCEFTEEGRIPIIKGVMFENNFNINYKDCSYLKKEEDISKYNSFIIPDKAVLISLVGSIGKISLFKANSEINLLNQNNIALIINQDFYNVKLFTYLIKNELRLVRDFLYKNNGYSFLNISDLFDIQLPKINIKIQNKIIESIEPIENEIKSLIQSQENEIDIINEEFAKFFDYEKDLFKTFGKGMTAGTQKSFEKKLNVFQTKFEDLVNSETLRFSTRFHRPEVKFLEFILGKYETIKVKSLLKENEKIHRGTQPKNSENGYIPAIKTGQLKNSYIDLSETDLVEENFYNNQLKARVMNKDILIASTGKVSLGKIDIYEEDQEAVCDGHISIIRVDSKKVINDYFVYFFRSILGTFQIERDYTGATNQIELYANEISSFDIIKVSLEDQARIVKKIKNRIQDQQNYTKQIEEKRTEIEKIILDSLQNV